jgi:hypothetical protein
VPHHKQQASECSGKQQHRELWPAYNSNVASPQASTEGLFQQTQLPSLIASLVDMNGMGASLEAEAAMGDAHKASIDVFFGKWNGR